MYCTSTLNRYCTPLVRTFDRTKNHRQAFDIIGADRLWCPTFAHTMNKLVYQPGMPTNSILFDQRRHLQLPHLRHKTAIFLDAGGANILATIPFRRASCANDAPIALPTRALALGTPTSTISKNNRVGHLKNADRRGVVLIP